MKNKQSEFLDIRNMSIIICKKKKKQYRVGFFTSYSKEKVSNLEYRSGYSQNTGQKDQNKLMKE